MNKPVDVEGSPGLQADTGIQGARHGVYPGELVKGSD